MEKSKRDKKIQRCDYCTFPCLYCGSGINHDGEQHKCSIHRVHLSAMDIAYLERKKRKNPDGV